jgi:hypothetical protein
LRIDHEILIDQEMNLLQRRRYPQTHHMLTTCRRSVPLRLANARPSNAGTLASMKILYIRRPGSEDLAAADSVDAALLCKTREALFLE